MINEPVFKAECKWDADPEDPSTEWKWRCRLCGENGVWVPASGQSIHMERRSIKPGEPKYRDMSIVHPERPPFEELMFRCENWKTWTLGSSVDHIEYARHNPRTEHQDCSICEPGEK